MRPIATDGVTWSVGLSVFHDHESLKSGGTVPDAIWNEDLSGPKEPCIRWGGCNFEGEKRLALDIPGRVWQLIYSK